MYKHFFKIILQIYIKIWEVWWNIYNGIKEEEGWTHLIEEKYKLNFKKN